MTPGATHAAALPARALGVGQGATLLRVGAVLAGAAAYALALPPFDRAGLAWVTARSRC